MRKRAKDARGARCRHAPTTPCLPPAFFSLASLPQRYSLPVVVAAATTPSLFNATPPFADYARQTFSDADAPLPRYRHDPPVFRRCR
jgi:hypothetical protein